MPLENEDRFDGPTVYIRKPPSSPEIALDELKPATYLFAPLLGAPGGYIIEKRNSSMEKLQVEGMLSVYGDRLPKQGLVYLVNSALKVVKTFKYKPIQTWQIQEDSSIKGNFLL